MVVKVNAPERNDIMQIVNRTGGSLRRVYTEIEKLRKGGSMKRAYSPTEVQQMNIPSFPFEEMGGRSDIPIVQVYGLFGVKAVMEKAAL